MKDTARNLVFQQLTRVLEGAGYVSPLAKDRLEEAVDIVFDDPRNAEEMEIFGEPD